jgi:hypothetical protein
MRPVVRAGTVLAPILALAAAAVQAQQAPPSPHQKAGIRLVCPRLIAHKDSEMKAIPFRVNGVTVYACSDVSIEIPGRGAIRATCRHATPTPRREEILWVLRRSGGHG